MCTPQGDPAHHRGPSKPGGKTLLLLANQFPSEGGDSNFLQNEISVLSAHFSQILVWNQSPKSTELVDLPANVQYMGRLPGSEGRIKTLLRLRPGTALAALRLFVRESLRRPANTAPPRVMWHAVLAAIGARDLERAEEAVRAAGGSVSLYSFWATDSGLPLAATQTFRHASVMRAHGYDLYAERTPYLPFRKDIFANVAMMAPIADHGARYLLDHYPHSLSEEKVVVSRLGTRDHGPGDYLDSPVIRVVSCSYITPVKRVDQIARALSLVAESYRVRWTHFGDGPESDRVAALVETMAGPNFEADLRGQTGNAEVVDSYRHETPTLLINLSSSEGVPVSIMEAISFGVPVVATDVGGTSEIVGAEHGTGILVPESATPEDVAAAVIQVAQQRKTFTPREFWAENYEAQANATRLVELLDGLG